MTLADQMRRDERSVGGVACVGGRVMVAGGRLVVDDCSATGIQWMNVVKVA